MAEQNIVNQSENGYGWDNYIDYELSIAIHYHSIKCFEMQDTNEKLRLTCGVTAAHCHWSRARSESDDWPIHTRFKGRHSSLNSIRDTVTRSGAVPLGCHAEINKSALNGQERYRAGSRREYRLVGLYWGRDRFASSGRAFSSAGSRIISLETIDLTETGRRWLTMFTFLQL